MANLTDRRGSALLGLTTRRPADSSRGAAIIHLELRLLPQIVANQVALWKPEVERRSIRAQLRPCFGHYQLRNS